MKSITYYAAALMPNGKIGQLRVTREMAAPGVCASKTQEWTGVVYVSARQAVADLARLNCQ